MLAQGGRPEEGGGCQGAEERPEDPRVDAEKDDGQHAERAQNGVEDA